LFQKVQRYVVVELYGCCKSRSEDVAYDSIVLKACCNSMFLSVLDISAICFACVFQTRVSVVFFGCYICSTHMLHVCLFGCLLIVAMISKCVSVVFSQAFHKYVSNVSTAFKLMLQLLFLDVSKVDQVFYLSSLFLLPHLSASSSPTPARHVLPLLSFSLM